MNLGPRDKLFSRYLVETLLACSDGLLSGFRAGDYVDFMKKMEQDHGRRIRADFKSMIS